MNYTLLSAAELDRYFKRIGYHGSPDADLQTLSQLHRLHPLAIAFENLDSWCGRAPLLDEAAVFAKLVDAGRGGYCFEQNQLFLRVLLTLGFQVQPLAARVIVPATSTARTHKVLLVKIPEGSVLADVGFGGMTMSAPLQLSVQGGQATPHEPWQLEKLEDECLASAQVLGEWSAKFRFSLQPQTPKDYEMSNWFVATHPASIFVNDLIAARLTTTGRYALLNTRLMLHQHNQSSVQTDLGGPADVRQVLGEIFGLNLEAIAGLDDKLAKLFSAV